MGKIDVRGVGRKERERLGCGDEGDGDGDGEERLRFEEADEEVDGDL